jgi:hypothetical protein
MEQFNKELKKFDTSELENINFGSLEGEKDDKLSDSFLPTLSIIRLLKGRYNYVLSPKGGGKSAVFRAIKDKLIRLPKSYFDYSKYSILGINEAFGFDSDYLPIEQFVETSNRKNYTISWAIYILSELIKDIKTNHSEKTNYSDLISKIKKIGDFKSQFQLYNIVDFVSQLSFGLSFTVGGQPIDIKPKLNFSSTSEPLVLNSIFKLINNFYKENNLTSLILIDRLDNFVRKESYQVQKNYVQGLIDCIEELANLENIAPVLFIRTDLFYSFDIDFEYDKLKERTQTLIWGEEETLNFILYRLLANEYINSTYGEYFQHVIGEGIQGEHRQHHVVVRTIWEKLKFWKKETKERLDLRRTLGFTIAEKYLRLFFPKNIELMGDKEFCAWIFEYLSDANRFVNPRLLIYFFNELIKEQIDCNHRFIKTSTRGELEAKNHTDYLHFDIFSQELFPEVYKKVQNDELINIFKILKNKEYQFIFKEINDRTIDKARFNYGDINIKKFSIAKDEYDRFLKYLTLLGYCREVDKQTYEVPKLYRYRMTFYNE